MTVSLAFDLNAPGIPANRRLLGNNLQWVDLADAMLIPANFSTDLARTREEAFDPGRLALAKALGPTLLRYPGGTLSDTAHWAYTIGPLGARTAQENAFTGVAARPDYGVAEHMALAYYVGADVIFTLNIPTGSPSEAAAWVSQMNVSRLARAFGGFYPKVKYWEIGNEPYLLHNGRPDLDLTPAAYVAAANATIAAMRAVDPTIAVALPVHSDTFGPGYQLGIQGYNAALLAGLTQNVDVAAIHTGYLPFLWNPLETYTSAQLWATTMASYRAAEIDLASLRAALDAHPRTSGIPFAMTEYNGVFTIGGAHDDYTQAFVDAMHVANMLYLLANRADVFAANLWSLSGNAYFGAISEPPPNFLGKPRPSYYVLQAYGDLLRGAILPTKITGGGTQANIQLGIVQVFTDTPTLAATVSRDGTRVSMLLINRDFANPITVALAPATFSRVANVAIKTLGGDVDPFATAERDWSWTSVPSSAWGAVPPAWPTTVTVPAHGVASLTIDLYGTPAAPALARVRDQPYGFHRGVL